MHTIRKIKSEDTSMVVEMMREFYSSPAVLSNGSDEIFYADVEACVGDNPFLEGYVFETEGKISGYAMISKGFSTESGKNRIWIEDLYIKKEFRGLGVGDKFIKYISEKYKECVIRLEVEEENVSALSLYKKNGFEVLPYMEMIKNS